MTEQNQNAALSTYNEKNGESLHKKPQNTGTAVNGSAVPQRSPERYSELLAQRLRTSEKIKAHPTLGSGSWTKTSYEVLAALIKEELGKKLSLQQRIRLGTSLSSRTLRKIALAEYKITQPADPRTLNTLNKIVIFLGYDHWQHFISTASPEQSAQTQKAPRQAVTEAVKAAVHNKYRIYYELPENAAAMLTGTHLENSPSFNFIMDMVAEKKEKKLIISNRFNPSACEILDISLKKLEAAYAQVATREYWRLCWWDARERRYIQRYKSISDHLYILNKTNGSWRVKTNASTADPMELK